MAAANNSIGYIVVDGSDGFFRGALLVVDYRGIPLDFRYTDPIRPSKLERILYGNALEVYLREELILESLVRSAEVKPTLWICREADLLAPLKAFTKGKVLFLSLSGRAPMDVTGNVEASGEDDTYMIQADAVSAPLRAVFSAQTKEDEVRQVSGMLVEAAGTMELLEPFGRIQKALASLGEE